MRSAGMSLGKQECLAGSPATSRNAVATPRPRPPIAPDPRAARATLPPIHLDVLYYGIVIVIVIVVRTEAASSQHARILHNGFRCVSKVEVSANADYDRLGCSDPASHAGVGRASTHR